MGDSKLARPKCCRRSEDSVEDLVEYEFSLDADTPSLAQSFFSFFTRPQASFHFLWGHDAYVTSRLFTPGGVGSPMGCR